MACKISENVTISSCESTRAGSGARRGNETGRRCWLHCLPQARPPWRFRRDLEKGWAVRPTTRWASLVSLAKFNLTPSFPSRYKLFHTNVARVRVFMSLGGQMGKLRLLCRWQVISAPYATRPSPVQRGLEMRWELLRTAHGYEMPVTKFFPAPMVFRPERWAVLSL